MKNLYLIISLLILCLMACSTEKVTETVSQIKPSSRLLQLQSDIQNVVDSSDFVGLGVGVVKDGDIVYTDGFGYSDFEHKKPYQPNNIQPIGSISKLFVGFAIAKAIELGHFNLDTKINDILPFEVKNPNFPDEAITIFHLVTHTSSITDSDLFWQNCYFIKDTTQTDKGTAYIKDVHEARQGKMPSLAMLMKNYYQKGEKWYSKTNFIKAKPGSTYEYSNVGSSLAAYLIEVKTGKSFKHFCKQYIFKPLEMNNTKWQQPKDKTLATILYLDKENPLPTYQLSSYPDGGLNTTTVDLTKFMLAMMKGYSGKSTLLKPQTFQLLFQKKFTTLPAGHDEGTNTGIFWDWMQSGRLGHNGADPGFFTSLSFNIERESGLVIIVNKDILGVDERRKLLKTFVQIRTLIIEFENETERHD